VNYINWGGYSGHCISEDVDENVAFGYRYRANTYPVIEADDPDILYRITGCVKENPSGCRGDTS